MSKNINNMMNIHNVALFGGAAHVSTPAGVESEKANGRTMAAGRRR